MHLLQIPAVTRANINSFLGAVDSGKVVMLVFSSQAQASLKIRNAVAEYKDFIKTGRVHIKTSEVCLSVAFFCPSTCPKGSLMYIKR